MASVFTRIVRGEIPCHKLQEDDAFLAFLDIQPINPGHTLIIPKVEVDKFFDLDQDTLSGLMRFARPVARAIERVVPCLRIGVIVAGLAVPHAHLHLIPIIEGEGDLSFSRARPADRHALQEMAERIREAIGSGS